MVPFDWSDRKLNIYGWGASFSPCRTYRYALWRIWNEKAPCAMFIALNPSTADECRNDPTVSRCAGYAKRWGYGGLLMANVFAYRSTYPARLRAVDDPVGPENDAWLKEMSKEAALVVAAWGMHGAYLDRGKDVLKIIPDLFCLGITKEGHPRHPLYLRSDCQPVRLSR